MRNLDRFLGLPASLLACLSLLSSSATAAQSIDVNLQAAFPSPPFLLELLETAAAENSSAYFPLVSTIASGHFVNAEYADAQLYRDFEKLLQDGGHITDPAALASWRLALATRESAPRIEAQYQFWRTAAGEVHSPGIEDITPGDTVPEPAPFEVWCEGKPYCGEEQCVTSRHAAPRNGLHHSLRDLQFDRINGNAEKTPLYTIYADLASPDFPRAFQDWQKKHPQDAYRIRYKPAAGTSPAPLSVSGYGVELALKRTDYIVIDDRESDKDVDDSKDAQGDEVALDHGSISDLKPLSSSELRRLDLKAVSYIMSNDDPLEVLLKVVEDFPRHAAALSQQRVSKALLAEHRANRDLLLSPGLNVLWMNGQQIPPRDIDAFSLLEAARRERKLVSGLQRLGLAASEAIDILTHSELSKAQVSGDAQRYDWRDEHEGGNAVLWLNDIEKDKRYKEWPESIQAFLQRTFPGQLPAVRKDTHTLIFPIDFTNRNDVKEVVEMLQGFVKRMIPIRVGLVPICNHGYAIEQSKAVYYLYQAYGLSAVMNYLQKSFVESKLSSPDQAIFEQVVASGKLRRDQEEVSFTTLSTMPALQKRADQAEKYLTRLGASDVSPPMFLNGVPVAKSEDWMQAVSQRLSADVRLVQQAVYTETLTQDSWIPALFLNGSSFDRNPFLIPEDESDVKLFDIGQIFSRHKDAFDNMQPFVVSEAVPPSKRLSILVIADLNDEEGAQLVLNATEFGELHEDVEIRLLHHSGSSTSKSSLVVSPEGMARIQEILEKERPNFSAKHREAVGEYLTGALMSQSVTIKADGAAHNPIAAEFGLVPGDKAILINGRLVGPVPAGQSLTKGDFETLLAYEKRKRVQAAAAAVEALKLDEKLTAPLALAQLSSIVALAGVSDVPEGIFENPSGPRLDLFNQFNSSYTCITKGDKSTAAVQLVASIDPASDTAQRWVSILKVLSELDGVHLRIFLNPKEMLEELPVKRFYRHVLQAAPAFNPNGTLAVTGARFTGIPEDALLTMTMDVAPSWLVAPAESVHDLDNIRLSSVKGQGNIEATYELESILIEGHSRDTTVGNPPRGAQLVLGTEAEPDFAGTLIMANLGYFQFKANPGVYNLNLQPGASQKVFSLDSAGTNGKDVRADDDKNVITLSSFKGATVFPRLSRKPGMERSDVLELGSSATSQGVSRGLEVAESLLAKAGLSNSGVGDYIAKGLDFGQQLLSMTGVQTSVQQPRRHADINIFSVASGHLYERMLNIMMVSVMRHTKHSVKFWFIEQFLSPSFKAFLPSMAAEYSFEYEMVTYKWPHWLRAQTEKQRTIWGYKILFLDVLFPLDLDKVIFVDADQIVRTDMYDLVQHDLQGAPYGFTPMCDSRTEMEGYRFWKQGYWATFLRGAPYHISALYVVDLRRFRQQAAGDRLRQQYQGLSADPNSLSNLDQDLPNHMQHALQIHSLPQEWLWCETWCSDESLKDARTIDLCNNPQTKEPKLDRARRQVPEWTVYDDEIAALARRSRDAAGGSHQGALTGEEQAREQNIEHARKKDEL